MERKIKHDYAFKLDFVELVYCHELKSKGRTTQSPVKMKMNMSQQRYTINKTKMKNIIYKVIPLVFLFCFVTCKLKEEKNSKSPKYYSEIETVLKPKHFKNYQVTRIDSTLLNNKREQEIYQIYAKKNDTLIKIISFKIKRKSKFGTLIKPDGVYDFMLITLNPEKYIDEGRGAIGISGTAISDQKDVYTFFYYEENTLYDVYKSNKLKGLYLIKN